MFIFLSLHIYYTDKFNCVKPYLLLYLFYQNIDVEVLCNLTSDLHIRSNNVSRINHTRHFMSWTCLSTYSYVSTK